MMTLKILLPSGIFADKSEVKRVTAQSSAGSIGLWPMRLDCVAALVPGILSYETAAEGALYVAVDTGILVKHGGDVLVSVRRAFTGRDLKDLRAAVERQFKSLTEMDRSVQQATVKLQAGLIAGFRVLHGA
jgi:F-type H+-transporting ATPase subunit epsilon